MRGFVAVTDHGWYQFLRARPELDEVNFWRPGGAPFAALRPGEPLFFKLKAPHHAIGGFGLFARFDRMPVWHAWDLFGPANGTADEFELRARLARLPSDRSGVFTADRVIGCIAVVAPVFSSRPTSGFPRQPIGSARSCRGGPRSDHGGGSEAVGRLSRPCARPADHRRMEWVLEADSARRFGQPQVIRPRLGQASFRLAVLDAYGGAYAVTTEHSLPVVDAAHIRPWAAGGRHEVQNGLPLRRDLHRLFDLGYVTVRPNHTFANGRRYYAPTVKLGATDASDARRSTPGGRARER